MLFQLGVLLQHHIHERGLQYDVGERLLVRRGPLEYQNITVIHGEVTRMNKITKTEAVEKLQEITTRMTPSAVVDHEDELEDHRDEGELPLKITDLRLWSPDEINRMLKQ